MFEAVSNIDDYDALQINLNNFYNWSEINYLELSNDMMSRTS